MTVAAAGNLPGAGHRSTTIRRDWCWQTGGGDIQPQAGADRCAGPACHRRAAVKLSTSRQRRQCVRRDMSDIDQFAIGSHPSAEMPVHGDPPPATARRPLSACLAGDLLALYDIEMDFAAAQAELSFPRIIARAMSSIGTHDRRGGGAHHAAAPHRQGSYRLPSTIRTAARISGPGEPGRQGFQAMIDTGATVSTISAETAKFLFDVTPDSPGSVLLGIADGNPNHRRLPLHLSPP